MKCLVVCFALAVFGISVTNAEVFWFEAEEYDEEISNPSFNEKGLNVAWDIKDDKDAFNKQYMVPRGGNRNTQEAAAGLVYIIPDVEKRSGWVLWIRCIMSTGGSDSFFWQLSQDGGEKWGAPTDAHGGGLWEKWQWHQWNLGMLEEGEDNALRIAERENNAKFDVICLRNDAQMPLDEDYEDYLKQPGKKDKIAVDARGKMADTWGRVKSNADLGY